MVNPYQAPGTFEVVRAELVEESFGQYTRRYFWSIRVELAIMALLLFLAIAAQ